jgi:heptosyltransferase II
MMVAENLNEVIVKFRPAQSVAAPQNILLVKNRAMGDSLMGLSTVQLLLEEFPEATIYYALPNWIVPLYKYFSHPRVKFLALKLDNLNQMVETYLQVRALRIDVIFELHLAGRSSKFFSLLSRLTGIAYGFHNHHLGPGTSTILDQGVIKPLIQRDLDGVISFFSLPKRSYLDLEPHFNFNQWPSQKKRLILGVVATRKTKMYPLESYCELIELVQTHYPEVEIVIPLSKSRDDQEIQGRLIELGVERLGAQIVHWSLGELPVEFARSAYYIGNDTGQKHLAIATGLKSYTLFGPEPPLEWHPYERARHDYYFFEPLDCRTVKAHFCGLSTCDSMICLNSLTAKDLFLRVEAWFKEGPAN